MTTVPLVLALLALLASLTGGGRAAPSAAEHQRAGALSDMLGAAVTAAPTEPLPPPALVGAPIELRRFAVRAEGDVWTSPWHEPGFPFTRLVPSWAADTPAGTWIEIEMQARGAARETRWYSFGRWAYGDGDVRRASVERQADVDGRIATDTFEASTPLRAYRIRVTLARAPGSANTATLRSVAAVAADGRATMPGGPSALGAGASSEIPVPRYSQEIHRGEYPEYDGGGEAWCSPTSTAMVLAHWGRGPSAAQLAWVDPRYADPQVDHAARHTYDAAYRGTGNWSFNVAYAAHFGLEAFVTQLRSLAEAELFVAAGIPLVASVKAAPGALPGFLLPQGSAGHLLVIAGFTADGDVIANDPAALSNAAVRRVYPREAFERAWLGGSGGIVYVIHPAEVELPARIPSSTPNW